jgi:hypothetical protein
MMEENQVLNKFAPLICFASLVLIAAMTISCGSSSSATKATCTGGPYDMVGDWGLLFNDSPYETWAGVINTAGLGIFFKSNTTNLVPFFGSEIVIPSITGACSFSENLTYYVTPAWEGGGEVYSDPVQATVQSGPAIRGTITEGTGSDSFLGLPQSVLQFPFTPTALTSTMTMLDESSPVADSVTVQVIPSGTGNSADMTLSGTDGLHCNVSGTFTQEGSNAANLNVFDVSLTFTGTGCQVTGTIQGLGFESQYDYFFTLSSGTFLYAMSGNSANVFDFYPQP